MLSDSALARALRAGLPLRFHFDVQLWRDRFLGDALEDRATWSLVLYQEPLSEQYALTRSWDPEAEEIFESLDGATRAVERWYQAPIRPRPGDSYYYEARLEVEILSLDDLAEIEHWLRGEVGGEGDVGSAITRGFRRLLIRLVGLSARTFSARTPSFRPE